MQPQELWIAAEADLYLQALDISDLPTYPHGNPTGGKTRCQSVEDVRIAPVFHSVALEEPGNGSVQPFTFVTGFTITLGPHDLRDIAAQIQALLSDTSISWRLLAQNVNPRYNESGPAHNETRDFRFVTLAAGPEQSWSNQRDRQHVNVALRAEQEIAFVPGT